MLDSVTLTGPLRSVQTKGGKLLFYYLHRDGFFVFGPMKLKIGGVTLLRVLNQWFTKKSVIFDISVYSGSIMISDVPFSTISMDLEGFDNNLKKY